MNDTENTEEERAPQYPFSMFLKSRSSGRLSGMRQGEGSEPIVNDHATDHYVGFAATLEGCFRPEAVVWKAPRPVPAS